MTIPDLAFPHWELLIWQTAWNGITLSATIAFARVVTGSTDALTLVACGLIAVIQVVWLTYHIDFVNQHVQGETPSTLFVAKPWPEWNPPACNAATTFDRFMLVFGPDGWLYYLLSFPFTLTEQGVP